MKHCKYAITQLPFTKHIFCEKENLYKTAKDCRNCLVQLKRIQLRINFEWN